VKTFFSFNVRSNLY